MNIKQPLETLIAGENLSDETMQTLMKAIIEGKLSDAQIAAFLALMRMKGETPQELTMAATVLLEHANLIQFKEEAIDIVGTGGDGRNTFNVSTAAAFVTAAAGIPVAKHGNRSVSSQSGSADLLQLAGINMNLTPAQHQRCLSECGLTFLFAPLYHPALQSVKEARQQLGIRTLFNLLGPLLNPARVKKQVVGVFAKAWVKPLAEVLANLGSQRFLVVHAHDGLDEFSIAAPTTVLEYKQGQFHPWEFNPQDYGLHYANLNELLVNSPKDSLEKILAVLTGQDQGPCRAMVLINAAAAIYCAQDDLEFAQALEQAALALDSGDALRCFTQLQQLSQALAKEDL